MQSLCPVFACYTIFCDKSKIHIPKNIKLSIRKQRKMNLRAASKLRGTVKFNIYQPLTTATAVADLIFSCKTRRAEIIMRQLSGLNKPSRLR